MHIKSYKIIVSGIVQGVWYRKYIQKYGKSLNIAGTVKNLPNGKVEIVANLDNSNRDKFLKLVKKGSPLSKVKEIEIEEIADIQLTDFKILY